MREDDELSTKTTPRYKKPAVVFDNYRFKMADKSNDGLYQPRKSKKERVWTNAEMKYLALVLAEEKKQYAVRLETLASKKSSNNQVFEEITKDFEKLLLSDEFKEDNEREESKSKGKQKNSPLDISPARLRIKYKFLRKQWRKFTDRVKMGSGKAPIEEPEWFTILNPIFSDTMGDMDAASSPSDVLSPTASTSSDEEDDNDRPNTSNNQDRAEESCDSADEISSETSSSSCRTKRKQKKPQLPVKPCLKKRARSQTQAMQEMAKTFNALGEQQQKGSETMVEVEKERQAEFFRFQREQAELNRQHGLKMVEIIMKFASPRPPVHYGST